MTRVERRSAERLEHQITTVERSVASLAAEPATPDTTSGDEVKTQADRQVLFE